VNFSAYNGVNAEMTREAFENYFEVT